jgi:hypothetical protein
LTDCLKLADDVDVFSMGSSNYRRYWPGWRWLRLRFCM